MGSKWIWLSAGILLLGVAASAALLWGSMYRAEPLETIAGERLPTMGSSDARNEIIVVTDFSCPACRRFYAEVMPAIRQQHLDTGIAQLRVTTLPVKQGSTELARVMHCLTGSADNWDELYARAYAAELTGKSVHEAAAALLPPGSSVKVSDVAQCANAPATAKEIERRRYEVLMRGITTVPAVIINRTLVENPWDTTTYIRSLSAAAPAGDES